MSKPWYEAAFGADYLERYRHRDVDEAGRAVATLLADVTVGADELVLDLCCGAGRHVVALRAHGHRVVGLDLSADLLEAAAEMFRERFGCSGSDATMANCPRFVRADKRRIPFAPASFALVTHFFTAFGYFESDAENLGVFAEVARVLRPGGWYLFDFLSAPQVLSEAQRDTTRELVEFFSDGARVETVKHLTPDGRRIEKTMTIHRGPNVHRTMHESVRLFTPSELIGGLEAAGLAVERQWGDYTGRPYDGAESTRWIALCRRPAVLGAER
ncbi:MAG: class I SAM-dependent methyltransferase [Candidatus Sumerlaeia bacterium]|nr:class I SAM-dependent methyltransferase [Candidatus Sumerlaeia bacterium]